MKIGILNCIWAAAMLSGIVVGAPRAAAIPVEEPRSATIAIDEFPADLQLSGDTAAAKILRSLITQPLFTVSPQKKIQNVLVDAIRQDFKTNALSVRLKHGIHFTNSAPIKIADVFASLQRCFSAQAPDLALPLKSHTALLSEKESEVWIDFPPLPGKDYGRLLDVVQQCPILDSRNIVVFRDDFGYGSNYIGAGEFLISSFKLGTSYSLARSDVFPEKKGIQQLEVTKSDDARKSLTMLRSGTIDALVTNDADTIASAREDSTLQLSSCFDKMLIKRPLFSFICTSAYDLPNVHYAT